MSRMIAALCALFLTQSLAAPVAALGPVELKDGWRTQAFSLFSSNRYGFGEDRITLVSNGSVSLTYRPLSEAFWSAERAAWSWAVAEGVPPTDLTLKGGDDRNLALYFVFLPEAEAQRLRGGNIRRLLRNDAARVLVYVWGGAHPRGAVLDSPYLDERGKTIVLRGAGSGQASEDVDIAADYARIFGGQAALVGLALSGDSDDTDTNIRAQVSGLALR